MRTFFCAAVLLTALIAIPAAGQSTLIVPGEALGDLTARMSLAEIKSRLGEPDGCGESSDGRVGACSWLAAGVIVSYDLPSLAVRVLTKQVVGTTVWRTTSGITGLSTSADVVRAHGKPDVTIVLPANGGTLSRVTLRYVDQGVQFTLVDSPAHLLHDRVVEIGIFLPGRFPKP